MSSPPIRESTPPQRNAVRFEPIPFPPPPRSPSPGEKPALLERVLIWTEKHFPNLFPIKKYKPKNQRAGRAGRKLQKKIPASSSERALAKQAAQQVLENEHEQPQYEEAASTSDEAAASGAPRRSTSRVSSIFGISSLIHSFGHEVETSFLTPVERDILERTQQLIPSSTSAAGGADVEPASDSEYLRATAAIQHLTRALPSQEKEMILRDLRRLLSPAQRVFLRRVVFEKQKVELRSRVAETGLTPQSVRHEAAGQPLKPSPARVPTIKASPRKIRSQQGLLQESLNTAIATGGDNGNQVEGYRTLFPSSPRSRRTSSTLHHPQTSPSPIWVQKEVKIARHTLRGGGSGKDSSSASQASAPNPSTAPAGFSLRQPTTPLRRLEDDERPHPILWWLAGGRVRRQKPGLGVPTAKTLRVRKELEKRNRQVVGFWGTVFGVRKVKEDMK